MVKRWDEAMKKVVKSEMYDILQETPVYQFMTKEAREEGLQEGLEKGLQEGREEGIEKGLETLRLATVDIVREKFPKIVRLARKQVAVVDDLATLGPVVVKISLVQTPTEAKQLLLALDEDEEEE